MKLACSFLALFLAFSIIARANPKGSYESDVPKVEKKVLSHLRSYFLTHAAEGVSSKAVPASVEIDIEKTEDVPGWSGRRRTVGTATIVTAGRYTQNYACDFEVISEIDDQDVVKIIDTTAKRKS